MGSGNPNLERACTSHVERKNGSLRQWCRRLTRLTYAFSKKKENLRAALALHFWYYNFARIHSSLSLRLKKVDWRITSGRLRNLRGVHSHGNSSLAWRWYTIREVAGQWCLVVPASASERAL